MSIKKGPCWHKAGRTDLWWENFKSGVAPWEFWKKNFKLEKNSLFNFVPHLRPYISRNLIRLRKDHSVPIKKLQ